MERTDHQPLWRKNWLRIAAVLGMAFALATSSLSQPNGLDPNSPWPKFHANSASTGIGRSQGATGISKWFYRDYAQMNSSPAVGADGTVYIGSGDDCLYAIDGATGDEKWAFKAGMWILSSPAISADGTIYFGSYDNNFYAVDGSTGQEKWAIPCAGYVVAGPNISPDGTIYICLQTPTNTNNLVAIDPASQSFKWAATATVLDVAEPAIGSDGTVYLSTANGIEAFDPSDGSMKWRHWIPGSYSASPAVGPDGTVYSASGESMLALNPDDGSVIWSFATSYVTIASPVVLKGCIYFGSEDGNFYALNAATGAELWSFDAADTICSSAAEATDGTLFFGTLGGNLFAVDSSNGEKEWCYQAGPQIISSPAIGGDGTLYVGCYGLLAISTAKFSNFYFGQNQVYGGFGTRGVIQVSAPGPQGYYVTLSSSSPAVQTPSSVIIPEGETGVSFAVNSAQVKTSETDIVSATIGALTRTAAITLNPNPIAAFFTSNTEVVGGLGILGVIQMPSPAGPSGQIVNIRVGSSVVQAPSTVTIPAGQVGISFPITTSPVSTWSYFTLVATIGSSSKSIQVPIGPNFLSNLYVSPTQTVGPSEVSGVVQLSAPAGPSGVTVILSGPSQLSLPASVTVPPGAKGASFRFAALAVGQSTNCTLTAVYGPSQATSTLVIVP